MPPKTIFIITGPTAVGKTALSIQLAQHLNTEIISADSRQCFRELNIGVAKPSEAELKTVKHYFINSHSIHDNVNAAAFEQSSLQWADEIFSRHDAAVMVGGTGLYIQAFCKGLDDIPPVSTEIRTAVWNGYNEHGITWLQQKLHELDPLFTETGNPQRMMRALEVVMGTGRSILSFHSNEGRQRPFKIVKIGLDVPRPELYERINQRVDKMMDEGLLEEAKELFPHRHLNALQTVGYTELFEHFEGKISLQNAIDLIKQHTRNYAKRQLTWFRRDPEIKWFSPDDGPAIIKNPALLRDP
ncbi:MAG TPA: tRNA (adenosine(37)-N6)-dimethylallyltransferase MiaA [Chitinophagaceae bacterium]|nr:tRNA (adenosine(37)-N6)-dimethylallyltransferase MiaA [Chitinophagaceae bacterium]